MSSTHESSDVKNNQICRVCLATGCNMYAMNNFEIFAYRDVVPTSTFKVIFNPSDEMHLCLFCRHLLRKVHRFMQHCLQAEEMLSAAYEQDLKPLSNKLHNFTTTTVTHQLPDDEPKLDEEHNYDDGRDFDDDVPLAMLKEEGADDDVWNGSDKKKINKNEDTENELDAVKMEMQPLQAVAQATNGSKKEKKRVKVRNSTDRKGKRQKVVKEGFSSRMVQETDEYVVIKLSKEQVMEEMAQRALTQEYQRSLFKCDNCVKGFNFEDVLLNHMQRHSPQNGFLKCEICSQYCPSVVSMRGHMKSHTTRYECKVCGIQRGSRQHLLEHHAIAHTANSATYMCRHCHFTTNKRTVMQRHARSHAATDKHACHRCGELFNSLETLRIHTARHDKNRLFRCEYCSRSFVYPSMLNKHVSSVHESADFYCVECDIKFKSQDNLRLHFKKAKRHRDASSYKYECPQCSQRFVTPATLAGHLTSAHGVPKQHSCAVCSREYSSRAAVRAHLKAAHGSATISAPCRVCDKTFCRKSVLCAHERTHTGERPFVCARCGAGFAQRATLRAHHAHRHAQKEDNDIDNGMTQEIPNEG